MMAFRFRVDVLKFSPTSENRKEFTWECASQGGICIRYTKREQISLRANIWVELHLSKITINTRKTSCGFPPLTTTNILALLLSYDIDGLPGRGRPFPMCVWGPKKTFSWRDEDDHDQDEISAGWYKYRGNSSTFGLTSGDLLISSCSL